MQFVFQNAPAPRGSDIPPETIVRIAEKVPEIAYVKEETLPPGPAVKKILANRPPIAERGDRRRRSSNDS